MSEAGANDSLEPSKTDAHPAAQDKQIEIPPPEVSNTGSISTRQQKWTLRMRAGAFIWGSVFLGLALVDATLNPFPGTEYFFSATGITLITIGITGKKSKKKGEDN